MLNEETFQGFGAGLPDFKTKVPIWVNVWGSCNGRCWSILRSFDLFYDHLVHTYICLLFGIFFPVWYVVPRKIWQPWYGAGRPDGENVCLLWVFS
jgi:hypothetical protein